MTKLLKNFLDTALIWRTVELVLKVPLDFLLFDSPVGGTFLVFRYKGYGDDDDENSNTTLFGIEHKKLDIRPEADSSVAKNLVSMSNKDNN